MGIKFNTDSLNFGLNNLDNKLNAVVMMYAQTKAPVLESKMKSQRPWTDRTGLAKATLNAKVSKPSNSITRITLAHGVDYGIWLELANEKNYAIIGPTIDRESDNYIQGMNNIMERIKI